jgi:hypothetical protein
MAGTISLLESSLFSKFLYLLKDSVFLEMMTLYSSLNYLIRNKEKLPGEWKEYIIATLARTMTKLTAVISKEYHCCHHHMKVYQISFSRSQVHN